jgi:hypothetical protein
MYQWHRRILHTLGFNAGILGDGRHEIWPVTVTTYDSAYIHMERMGDRFALVHEFTNTFSGAEVPSHSALPLMPYHTPLFPSAQMGSAL